MLKTCGNCVNCEKYTSNGKEKWACENAYNQVGMPVDVYPPSDEACKNWSNKAEDKNRAENELRNFVDNYWNRS